MMKLLRHQSQWVLTFVLAMIGIGFFFYGNSGNLINSPAGQGNGNTGEINGTTITYNELVDAVRTTRDGMIINGQGEMLKQDGGQAKLAQETWRQLLLLAEADKLHINPTDNQVADVIRNMSVFQDPKTGVYSSSIYLERLKFIQTLLNTPVSAGPDPMEETQNAFFRVIRNNIRLKEVFEALFGTVRGSDQGAIARYDKVSGPAQVSVVTLNPKSFVDAAQVSDAEIEEAYKAHPQNPAFRSKEKRKVDYVLLTLTPEQAKLPDEEKRAAKNALGEKAIQLAMACLPEPSEHPGTAPAPVADFVTEAKKEGLSPVTSDFFTVDSTPANVPPSPAFNNAAFALSKDDSISKVVDLDNGVAVLHLAEIQPSDLLPLDAVKADITKQLKQEKGTQAEDFAAGKTSEDLKAGMTKGTDFKTAAAALKLTVETLPPVIPLKAPENDERLQTVAYVVTTLEPGQVCPGPVPTGDGNIIILHLDSRGAADPAGLADFEAHYRQSVDRDLQGKVFMDWVNWVGKQPGTHPPDQLEAYGGIE